VARSTGPGSSTSSTDISSTSDTTRSTSATQSTDEQLTPTGRTSADQSPASAATAMAIRQALDSDETLAQENVQVTTKIVLQGTVESEEAKKRAEEVAKQAASNAQIDNQITVEKK
jgi:osmotically-inducible protein OsmY